MKVRLLIRSDSLTTELACEPKSHSAACREIGSEGRLPNRLSETTHSPVTVTETGTKYAGGVWFGFR
jgi:hypothetical protein